MQSRACLTRSWRTSTPTSPRTWSTTQARHGSTPRLARCGCAAATSACCLSSTTDASHRFPVYAHNPRLLLGFRATGNMLELSVVVLYSTRVAATANTEQPNHVQRDVLQGWRRESNSSKAWVPLPGHKGLEGSAAENISLVDYRPCAWRDPVCAAQSHYSFFEHYKAGSLEVRTILSQGMSTCSASVGTRQCGNCSSLTRRSSGCNGIPACSSCRTPLCTHILTGHVSSRSLPNPVAARVRRGRRSRSSVY